MRFLTRTSQLLDAAAAVASLCNSLDTDNLKSLIVYYTDRYDSLQLQSEFVRYFPNISIIGCSSCKGVMTESGCYEGDVVAIMAIYDSSLCAYGTGIMDLTAHTEFSEPINQVISQALKSANREGEVPSLVVLHATPGNEEKLIQAIDSHFGTLVPIIGGSAADNSIAAKWSIFTEIKHIQNGVAIQLFFPSKPIATGFSAGYSPTEFVGTITKSDGRYLHEIDGEPAKEIYKEWISDHSNIHISDEFIFEHVTSFPLGRIAGYIYEQPYYKLTHPIRIMDNGALELFADSAVGEEITLMTGSREQLINRASRVIKEANSKNYTESEKLGSISIFCAGAMLRLGSELKRAHEKMCSELDGKPFICPFTYGEQGRFIGGENAHGNLMISSVIFYDSE